MARLSNTQVRSELSKLDGWEKDRDFIRKSFKFRKFMDGIAFVDKVALVAERLEHHPDIDVVWTTVTLRIQTHDEGGLTTLDFGLAAEIDKTLGSKSRARKR